MGAASPCREGGGGGGAWLERGGGGGRARASAQGRKTGCEFSSSPPLVHPPPGPPLPLLSQLRTVRIAHVTCIYTYVVVVEAAAAAAFARERGGVKRKERNSPIAPKSANALLSFDDIC